MYAHDLDTGYICVVERPDRIEWVLTLDAQRVSTEFGPGLDAGTVKKFQEYVHSRFKLETDPPSGLAVWDAETKSLLSFSRLFEEVSRQETEFTKTEKKPFYVHLSGHVALKQAPRKIRVSANFLDHFGNNHVFLIRMERSGRVETGFLNQQTLSADFIFQKERSLWQQSFEFIRLGVKHIFLGYDHLLFLLAILIVGGRSSSLLKIVTSFTVAHSLTLSIAALGWLEVAPRWTESAIAFSVAYVGIENLFLRSVDHRWKLTFFFGLAHGFGFASVLRELGLPTRGLIASLLSFNVGVELGQLIVAVCLLPLIFWFSKKHWHKTFVRGVSVGIAMVGIFLFFKRIEMFKFII